MFDLRHLGTRFSKSILNDWNQNCTITKVVTEAFLRAHHGSFIPNRIDQGVEMLRYHTS